MTDRVFLDSNVILYAFLNDAARQERARQIMDAGGCVISNQVVAEVSSNLIRKAGYSNREIADLTREMYLDFEVRPIDQAVFIKSAELRERYSISFWDSLILASALLGGSETLYSEDMQNGQQIEGMTIVNPFQ
jgi:predicted nucleic acid-binding protein